MTTFQGTVEPLGAVDVGPLQSWVAAIPYTDWPQQRPLADGRLRPAMVNDLAWHGFGAATDPVVTALHGLVPAGLRSARRLLSVVMPGHEIPPHVDPQPPDWWGRVHVPIVSDPASQFFVLGQAFHLRPGTAYAVNTLQEHAVSNVYGVAPRVHFIVDWSW